MGISVLILTHNEELNLPHCLEAVKWSDDVVVFDDCSTDRTLEIARAAGARIVERKWDNENAQRTASMQVGFKHPWVYCPDADEIPTPGLVEEMHQVAADESRPEVAYRVRFRVMFMGKWIKHASFYPTWVVRLLRPDKISFQREINLRYVIDGPEGRLQEHFDHYTFRKGIHAWFEKHNQYSDGEAREAMRILQSSERRWRNLFSGDRVKRRAAWKDLSYRVPFRPQLMYCYLMFVRLGVLDGPAGWLYCRMRACYETMISAKIKELRRLADGRSI